MIALHNKDIGLLELIKIFFQDAGNIIRLRKDPVQFQINSIKDLGVIINHFHNFPLITEKWADYQLFKQAFTLVSTKEHLTKSGMEKLIAIKASINKALSHVLKQAFDVIPVTRPLTRNKLITDPFWLAGFTSAEGCFLINIKSSKTNKIGSSVWLRFTITQHSRDEILLKSFVNYLACGKYSLRCKQNANDFILVKFADINEKIIPFF